MPVEVSKTGAIEGDALDEGAFEVDVLGVCAGTEEEGAEGEEGDEGEDTEQPFSETETTRRRVGMRGD